MKFSVNMRNLIEVSPVEQKAFMSGFRTALEAVVNCENCNSGECESKSCKLEAWFKDALVSKIIL